MPDWYKRGIEAALLAPTAMNQQKFEFSREDNVVSVKATGSFYSKVDLGIVKYHFEVGAKKITLHGSKMWLETTFYLYIYLKICKLKKLDFLFEIKLLYLKL